MVDFKSLKKNAGSLDKLKAAAEALNDKGGNNDENYWSVERDKAGNGSAVIRFLPSPEVDGADGLPWIKIFSHGFQGPNGQWFIDNCLTTKNKDCPVCESNSELWNTGIEANKTIVRERKRRLHYISNIYVVSDPKHPENEGKVFLFKFGKKIFDKLTEAMNPQFDDETPTNPFCLWTGANFKLKVRKVDGFANYDKSEFDSPKPLSDNDSELEKIYKSEFSLLDVVADKEFKSYDDLKKRLDRVLGLSETAKPKTTVEKLKESAKNIKPVEEDTGESVSEDEEDDLAYFASLANED